MVRQIGVLLAGTGAGLYPVLSCALGLGDIQVQSRLDQPLRARIEIVGVGDQDNPIRARVAADLVPGDGAVNAELLRSLRLSVEADPAHRFFVVVTSAEALTEPLFDLPVEVSEQSLQVVRNYSVFLDPAPLEEGGRSSSALAATSSGQGAVGANAATPRRAQNVGPDLGRRQSAPEMTLAQEAVRNQRGARAARGQSAADASGAPGHNASAGSAAAPRIYTVTRSDTLGRIARRLGARAPGERSRVMRWIFEHNPEAFRGGMRHLRVGAKLTLPESAGQKAPPVVAGGRAAQDVVDPGASPAQEQLEAQLTTLQRMLAQMQETIAAQDAQIAKLTRQIAVTSRVQQAQSQQRETPQNVAPAEAVEDESEPRTRSFWVRPTTYYGMAGLGAIGVILAWIVARLRQARQVIVPRYPVTEHAPATQEAAAAHHHGMDVSGSAPPSGRESAVSLGATLTEELPTVALDSVALDSMLEIAATGEYGGQEGTGAGPASSGRELAADTDVMPFVMKPENQIKPVERRPAVVEGRKLDMQPDGSVTNKEIIKLLEHSLDNEPHRVDLQLKLLEMYHQEALGNLGNFHSLLDKVGADRRGLSPAQISYVEMLQRTLDGGKTDSTSEPRAEAAV
jgi:Tfp pilus assembly protein FimV